MEPNRCGICGEVMEGREYPGAEVYHFECLKAHLQEHNKKQKEIEAYAELMADLGEKTD